MLNYSEKANQSDCLKHQDHWVIIYNTDRFKYHEKYPDFLEKI